MFNDSRLKWALFRGKEMEGRHRGLETLFVAGNPPEDEVLNVIKSWQPAGRKSVSKPKAAQIYFGAGGLFRYDMNTVYETAKLINEVYGGSVHRIVVTVENPEVDWGLLRIFGNTEWMVPVYDPHGTWRGEGLKQVRQIAMLQQPGQGWEDSAKLIEKIQLKYDFEEHVMVFPAKHLILARHHEYYGDELISADPPDSCTIL